MMLRSLLAVLLLAAVANPETASCRVNSRPTDWTETRIMLPASGPFTTLGVELCVAFDQTVALENMWAFGGTRWQVANLGIVVDVSFDPTFAPGFEVVPSTTLMLSDVFGAVGPFDGSMDFAGTSGEAVPQSTQALVTATLAVTDPTFFQAPWPVYLRTRTLPWSQSSASSAMAFSSTASAGAGLVVTYLP
ncbi:hypothetical protein [Caudoviricetes sp.]|nr:hypothetical protein [Caudoviricetes sp.]UOF82751.1 hypothetical protein [Caudoviricetes sp.]